MEQSEIVQLSARGVVLSVVSVLMSTEGMVRVHLPSVEEYWKQSGVAKQIKGKGRGFFEKRRAVYVKKVPKYDVGGHETDANWAANESFEISKFKFKFPRARTFELLRARSRLYRSQILQVNTRWKALEIYTMHSFAPFSWDPSG